MLLRKYSGWNDDDDRAMLATVTGQLYDGALIYTECDCDGNLINIDRQYYRTTKHGTEFFFEI